MGALALAAFLVMGVSASVPDGPTDGVLAGVDVLREDGFQQLQGRRVGLITNATGRTRDGVSTAQLLLEAPGVELRALFTPEHGLSAIADGPVSDSVELGLPVHSLYGRSRKPTRRMLQGLDVLVFDVQDAGTRFYTYISTMGLAMEAAAEAGLAFMVLDRPNPINGVDIEGPLLDEGAESFTGFHRIAVRHGMTVCELSLMFNDEREIGVDLELVPMQGWHREMFFDETGLPWRNPSPNLRSPVQALLYSGVGLLEFTNVSVGRGTETPFELVGAPWMDGKSLAIALNSAMLAGIDFEVVEFTPTASVFKGEPCGGVRFVVTDRVRLQPVLVGLEIAVQLRKLHGSEWDMDSYQVLLRNNVVLDALKNGASAPELALLAHHDLQEFRERRQPFLLYPPAEFHR